MEPVFTVFLLCGCTGLLALILVWHHRALLGICLLIGVGIIIRDIANLPWPFLSWQLLADQVSWPVTSDFVLLSSPSLSLFR